MEPSIAIATGMPGSGAVLALIAWLGGVRAARIARDEAAKLAKDSAKQQSEIDSRC